MESLIGENMNNYDDEEKTVMTYIDPYTSAARTVDFSDNERWQDAVISFAEMINGDEYTTCGGWAIDIDVLRNFVEAAAEAASIKRESREVHNGYVRV